MNKEKFEKLAYKTGAATCSNFDWCYLLKECCSKGGDYKPCLVMKNKKCDFFDKYIKE